MLVSLRCKIWPDLSDRQPVGFKPQNSVLATEKRYDWFMNICDRLWENPAYGIHALFAQHARFQYLRSKTVKSSFCHIYVGG